MNDAINCCTRASCCSESQARLTTSHISFQDRWSHFKARTGILRNQQRVEPGLYRLGKPGPDSPVLVTANFKPSFNSLRRELNNRDAWILVLNTQGINVWCAAGKGTFGTEELINRIKAAGLENKINHKRLILPQLGAAGVCAHEVKKKSGFTVEYGPVRAADLPEYLDSGRAGSEMRRVRFPLAARLVLIPVELNHSLLPMLLFTAAAWWLGGPLAAGASAAAFLSGIVIFPALLPALPARDFSTKGFILGVMVTLPFIILKLTSSNHLPFWHQFPWCAAMLMIMPVITAFLSLNFTGCTPYTSKSVVKREMRIYIPIMAWLFGPGVILLVVMKFLKLSG